MKLQQFFLAIVIASLLLGCASSAKQQPDSSKVLEDYQIPMEPIGEASVAKPGALSSDPPADCPATVAGTLSFEAPEPFSPNAPWPGTFWFGSENLWTALDEDGVWQGLPHNRDGYTQKLPWWREGYVWNEEPEPALTVSGKRLDASAPPLNVSKATNAYAEDMGSAMMVGVDFPTLGCWKITGKYARAKLSFVVWVAP